jgi:hypothetical protein
MMNVNSVDSVENTTFHTNVSFNVNIVNLGIDMFTDSNTILHENHINSPLENTTTTITTTTNANATATNTTQPQTRRALPPSIVIVSSDDEEDDIANNINTNLRNKNDKNDKNDKDKKLKIGLKTGTRSKSSLKKIKNVNNKLDNNSIDDERESSTKRKLTIYTYEQLKTEKYKMDELRKLCSQYKVSRAGNKEEITKRLYDYCKNSIVPLKIQKVVRGFLHRKLIKLRGPAFEKRNICTNETDFFTMDEMHEIPCEQFYSYKDIDGFIYGFNIISLYNLISKEGENTKNPYNRNSITNDIKQDIRRIVKLSALLKTPLDIVIKQEIMDPRKRMEMKILEIFQTMNLYGNYSNSEWFTELSRNEHIRFARELYDIWNYRAQLTNLKKYEICPPHGNPFLGTDVLIRFNVQIIENLVKSAIDIDNKTLGSFYVLTALTLVSQPAREAMPWLYEAGVYGGYDAA